MAITQAGQPLEGIQRAQKNDPTISVLYTTLLSKNLLHILETGDSIHLEDIGRSGLRYD